MASGGEPWFESPGLILSGLPDVQCFSRKTGAHPRNFTYHSMPLARSDHLLVDGVVIILARTHVAVLEVVRTLMVDAGF
jgi:hypothetical protein